MMLLIGAGTEEGVGPEPQASGERSGRWLRTIDPSVVISQSRNLTATARLERALTGRNISRTLNVDRVDRICQSCRWLTYDSIGKGTGAGARFAFYCWQEARHGIPLGCIHCALDGLLGAD